MRPAFGTTHRASDDARDDVRIGELSAVLQTGLLRAVRRRFQSLCVNGPWRTTL